MTGESAEDKAISNFSAPLSIQFRGENKKKKWNDPLFLFQLSSLDYAETSLHDITID